jgi:hypothetical protein
MPLAHELGSSEKDFWSPVYADFGVPGHVFPAKNKWCKAAKCLKSMQARRRRILNKTTHVVSSGPAVRGTVIRPVTGTIGFLRKG